MNIIEALKWRYSTKMFNPEKTISDEHLAMIKDMLRLSPSSTNLQPWHFIIATTDEGKKRIAKGATGVYSFNEPKVLDAPVVIVFATSTELTKDHLDRIIEKEDKDGRFIIDNAKEQQYAGRLFFANSHRYDLKDFQHWADKQVYINVGTLLTGVAILGIDSVPMEGFDFKTIDQEFGLREKGFMSCVVVSLGYHADDDFNSNLPKSRLDESEIIEMV